jgi:hypothetical protein
MKKLALLLTLLASFSALIGCGKSATVAEAPADVKPVGAALTVEAYSAKLTELGTEAQTLLTPELKKVQDAKAEPDKEKKKQLLQSAFDALAKIQDGEVGKYQAINPPVELAAAHAVIIQGNKNISQNFREGAAALSNNDDAKIDELKAKLETIATDMVKDLTAALDKAGYKLDAAGNIVKK